MGKDKKIVFLIILIILSGIISSNNVKAAKFCLPPTNCCIKPPSYCSFSNQQKVTKVGSYCTCNSPGVDCFSKLCTIPETCRWCTYKYPEKDVSSTHPDLECGDRVIEDPEVCDDGNTVNGDGCDSQCEIEHGWYCSGEPSECYTRCGDGIRVGDGDDDNVNLQSIIIESGGDEECDDGNIDNGDGCNSNCKIEEGWYCISETETGTSQCSTDCGDGVPAGNEDCDDGSLNGQEGYCNSDCTGQTKYCGDGEVQTPNDFEINEECDDGNTKNDDCCSNDCKYVSPPEVDKPGVCAGSIKKCIDGDWENPDFTEIDSYEKEETTCDNLDNDCDGEPDEFLKETFYLDLDLDGYGTSKYPLCPSEGEKDEQFSKSDGDCNDEEPDINPGVKDFCGDEIDNDCDGTPDNNCNCNFGDVINCEKKGGVCSGYNLICGEDGKIPNCEYSSISNYEKNEITCDNLDNDCDGIIDEGCDDDGDHYTDDEMECKEKFLAKDGQVYSCKEDDCDDEDPEIHPNNKETCDGKDNDCDGQKDNIAEEDIKYCHEIIHGYNNIGSCQAQLAKCDYTNYKSIGGWYCPFQQFYSEEICIDEIDNDCDGLVDEDCPCDTGEERVCGSEVGECTKGIQKCVEGKWGECLGSKQPSEEQCDNLDNDCDNKIDEDIFLNCTVGDCQGQKTCEQGAWQECQAVCSDSEEIHIKLSNEDIGNFVVDAKLSRDDVKDSLETMDTLNQTVSFNYKQESTEMKNTISPGNKLKDVNYILNIPKCLSPYLEDIEFEKKDYTIIKDDPLIAWHFTDVDDRIDLSYKIDRKIDKECLEQIKGMPIARVIEGKIEPKKDSGILRKFVLPSLIIFVAIGVVLYINKTKPEQKVQTEQEYEEAFIKKQKNNLLKKVKSMKFKTKEQARNHLKKLGVSEETIDWILQRI